MDTTDKPSQEELAAEAAATAEIKEDEVRAKIIADYGFDAVDDAERIDKLAAKEVESRKALSAAIGQKIKYRTDKEKLAADPRLKESPQTSQDAKKPLASEDIEKTVAGVLEKRDLESLEYPDDIKKDIQRVAQIQGVSIKQAARDPYIISKIEAYDKQQKVEGAGTTRTNRSGTSKEVFSADKPPDVDMKTPEGRKKWEEWKAQMVKEGN